MGRSVAQLVSKSNAHAARDLMELTGRWATITS
jgi:hypothetical protein